MQRDKRGKKISVFYTLIVFIVLIVLIGFYINNIIVFHNLIRKNKELREKLVQLGLDNYKKKMEIESLTSFIRIKKLVSERINMTYNENAIDKREIVVIMKDSVK